MTSDELQKTLNNTYGFSQWPKQIAIDSDTFADVCSRILMSKCTLRGCIESIKISIGPSGGIMFKNVELILGKDI